jgi:tRNA(fMet)-specific endonuclease VapC
MTLYMLDTNAASDLVADPRGRLASKIADVRMENVAISVVVSAEIEFGLEQKLSERLTGQMRRLLATLRILPLEPPADRHYGMLRALFRKQGRPIGPNDLFIAAHALALEATLVTANVGEFSRVPGLKIENWLRA